MYAHVSMGWGFPCLEGRFVCREFGVLLLMTLLAISDGLTDVLCH